MLRHRSGYVGTNRPVQEILLEGLRKARISRLWTRPGISLIAGRRTIESVRRASATLAPTSNEGPLAGQGGRDPRAAVGPPRHQARPRRGIGAQRAGAHATGPCSARENRAPALRTRPTRVATSSSTGIVEKLHGAQVPPWTDMGRPSSPARNRRRGFIAHLIAQPTMEGTRPASAEGRQRWVCATSSRPCAAA